MDFRIFFHRAGSKIHDAIFELRHTKSSWLEFFFAVMALSGAVWSYFQPFAAEWFEAPEALVATSFLGVGLIQLGAFLWREIAYRRNAAAVAAIFWIGVSFMVISGNVGGWMGAVGPVIVTFQVVVWRILNKAKAPPSITARGAGGDCG